MGLPKGSSYYVHWGQVAKGSRRMLLKFSTHGGNIRHLGSLLPFSLSNLTANYISDFDKSTQDCNKWSWEFQATDGELSISLVLMNESGLFGVDQRPLACWQPSVEGRRLMEGAGLAFPVAAELRLWPQTGCSPGFLRKLPMWREFVSSSESRRKSWPETVQRKALEGGRDGDMQPKCGCWHSLWQAKPQPTQRCPSRTLCKNHVFKLGNNIEPGVLIHTLFSPQAPTPHSHTLFSWAPKSLQLVTAALKFKDACSLEEKPWLT